jgi:hypothetical protein
MAETDVKKKIPVSKMALYVTIGLVVVVLIYYYVTHKQPAGPAMSSTGINPSNQGPPGAPGPPGPAGPAGPAGPPASHNKTHKGEHNGGN